MMGAPIARSARAKTPALSGKEPCSTPNHACSTAVSSRPPPTAYTPRAGAASPRARAIYLHFSGKQEIVLSVAREVLSRRLGDLGATEDGGPPDPMQTMRSLLGGMVDDVIDTRVLVQLHIAREGLLLPPSSA
jgi:hypothetical protein